MPSNAKPLDLSALDREGGTPEPFRVTLNDREYVLIDAQEVDWQILLKVQEEPGLFIPACMSAEDSREFRAQPLPMWKLNVLIDAYREHFGIPSSPEAGASRPR